MPERENNPTYQHCKGVKDTWWKQQHKWGVVYRICAVAGVVCSIVGTSSAFNHNSITPFFSLVAAIFFGYIGIDAPAKKQSRFMQSYITLNMGMIKFNAGLIEEAALINVLEASEAQAHWAGADVISGIKPQGGAKEGQRMAERPPAGL